MTRTQKQILPALHNSNKVSDPDLSYIGDRNYTATILKYSNLAVSFPQLKTDAKQVIPAINECRVIANPSTSGAVLETENGEILEAENGDILEADGIESDGGGAVSDVLRTIMIKDVIYSVGGSRDYEDLSNKPSINGVTLSGSMNSSLLGIPYSDLKYKPSINGHTLDSRDYSTTSLGIWYESSAKLLAAGEVSVSFFSWEATSTSTIQVFTSTGIDYNSISVDNYYTVTVYFDAQPNDEWVKVRIS